MRPLVSAAVLILLAPILAAQPAPFGEPFPLTETRFGTTRGSQPLLIANGAEPVLFWLGDRRVQVARSSGNGFAISRAVLDADGIDAQFDAVWTGRHFFVVAAQHIGVSDTIFGRLVDAEGEPLGEPFRIVDGRHPRIAFDGNRVLLIFVPRGTIQASAFLLSAEGVPAESGPRSLEFSADGRMAIASNGSSFAAVIARDFDPRLILFDSRGRVTSESVIAPRGASASIASDGRRYLATLACGPYGPCGPTSARIVEADGKLGPELELDAQYHRDPSAVWTGSKWTVAYTRDATQTQPAAIQQVTLDADARAIESREQRAGTEPSVAAVNGEVLMAAVGGRRLYDTIFVNGIPASFTARRQQVLATATSLTATLVVWQEIGNDETTLHTGVRDRAGRWTERQLATVPLPGCCYEEDLSALAASDGRGFQIVTSWSEGTFAQRLDALGAPISPRERLQTSSGGALLWTGSEYRLIGREVDSRIGYPAAFATDGNGKVFAAWPLQTYRDHAPVTLGIATLSLGDPAPSMIPADLVFGIAAAWDGTRLVLAWNGYDNVTITRAGDVVPRIVAAGAAGLASLTALADHSVAMLFRQEHFQRVAVLRPDGTISPPITVADDLTPAALAALPGGGMAFVQSIDDRLVMRLSGATPPWPARRRSTR